MRKQLWLATGFLVFATAAQAQTTPAPTAGGRAQIQVQDPSAPGEFRASAGNVAWHAETQASTTGGAAETVLVAVLDFPSQALKGELTLHHNTDPAFPAQFLAQMKFEVLPNSPDGNVADVKALTTGPKPDDAGFALDGAMIKVTNNVFLLGVLDPFNEKGREVRLLNRPWFHINAIFDNGHRTIMTFEKGEAGQAVFKDTMALWAKDKTARK